MTYLITFSQIAKYKTNEARLLSKIEELSKARNATDTAGNATDTAGNATNTAWTWKATDTAGKGTDTAGKGTDTAGKGTDTAEKDTKDTDARTGFGEAFRRVGRIRATTTEILRKGRIARQAEDGSEMAGIANLLEKARMAGDGSERAEVQDKGGEAEDDA